MSSGWPSIVPTAAGAVYHHGTYIEVRAKHGLFAHAIGLRAMDGAKFEAASTSTMSVEELRQLLAAYSLPRWSVYATQAYDLDSSLYAYELGAGFPLRWLVVTTGKDVPPGDVVIARNSPLHDATGLQGRVLVSRLVASIVLVFVIVLGLLQLPATVVAIRRHQRVRRGLCGQCGYPAGGMTCPECGNTTAAGGTTSMTTR
jgi:hypothetical protein